jgi:hypothetical protein
MEAVWILRAPPLLIPWQSHMQKAYYCPYLICNDHVIHEERKALVGDLARKPKEELQVRFLSKDLDLKFSLFGSWRVIIPTS